LTVVHWRIQLSPIYTTQLLSLYNSLNRLSHPWILLGSVLAYPGLDSFLLGLKVLTPPLDSDSISIRTCFLNLLLEFIRTPYPSNHYPISLPYLIQSAYPNLARIAYPNSTRVPYSIASMLTRPYTFISDRIILPDSPTDRTSTYPALHDLTWPNYLTRSLPNRTSAYPIVPSHLTRLPYLAG
jgi:hypothetical protein